VTVLPTEAYIKIAKLAVIRIFYRAEQFCAMGYVLDENFPNIM